MKHTAVLFIVLVLLAYFAGGKIQRNDPKEKMVTINDRLVVPTAELSESSCVFNNHIDEGWRWAGSQLVFHYDNGWGSAYWNHWGDALLELIPNDFASVNQFVFPGQMQTVVMEKSLLQFKNCWGELWYRVENTSQ